MDTGTAAADIPVERTAAADKVVWGTMAVEHTAAVAGNAVVAGRPELVVAVAAAGNRLLEVEDTPEASENRTVVDTAFDHALDRVPVMVGIRHCTVVAVLKLQNIPK